MESITIVESRRLVELEAKVSTGLTTFVEVGEALMAIRDEKLYRVANETFEGYCRDKWNFTDNFARRMIRGAEIVANIKTVPTGTLPVTERQARPHQPTDGYRQCAGHSPSSTARNPPFIEP